MAQALPTNLAPWKESLSSSCSALWRSSNKSLCTSPYGARRTEKNGGNKRSSGSLKSSTRGVLRRPSISGNCRALSFSKPDGKSIAGGEATRGPSSSLALRFKNSSRDEGPCCVQGFCGRVEQEPAIFLRGTCL